MSEAQNAQSIHAERYINILSHAEHIDLLHRTLSRTKAVGLVSTQAEVQLQDAQIGFMKIIYEVRVREHVTPTRHKITAEAKEQRMPLHEIRMLTEAHKDHESMGADTDLVVRSRLTRFLSTLANGAKQVEPSKGLWKPDTGETAQ